MRKPLLLFYFSLFCVILFCFFNIVVAEVLTLRLGTANWNDSYISEEYRSQNFGSSEYLNVQAEDKKRMHTLIFFDLSVLREKIKIKEAYLELYLSGGSGNSFNVSVYPISRGWLESRVSWDSYDGIQAWSTKGGDYLPNLYSKILVDNTPEVKRWNVTSFIQDVIDKKIDNFGLILVPSNIIGKNNYKSFISSNSRYAEELKPSLIIDYLTDITPPVIFINSPQNISYNTRNIPIEYNVEEEELVDCWYSLDDGENIPLGGCSGAELDSLTEGPHNLKIYAIDKSNNINYSSVNFIVDSISPTFSFSSPTEQNGTILNKNFILINLTSFDSNTGISNITGYLFNSSGLVFRNVSFSNNFFLNYSNLREGAYFFNATIWDNAGNFNNTQTLSFFIDDKVPNIYFSELTAKSGESKVNSIPVDVIVSDTNRIYSFINFNNSLIAFYKMNESSGNIADYSGMNAFAVPKGTLNYSQKGIFGKAIGFDGLNSWAESSRFNFSRAEKNFTISFWIYPQSFPLAGWSPLAKGVLSSYSSPFLFYGISAGQLRFYAANSSCSGWAVDGSVNSFRTNSLDLNKWHLITVVKSGKNYFLYHNSTLIRSFSSNEDLICNNSNYNLSIGSNSLGGHKFNGTIDEVLIFDRALSSDEIGSLYSSSSYFVNFTNLSEGDYQFYAYTQDIAGNENKTETRKVNVKVDKTPPLITIINPENNKVYGTQSVFFDFSVYDENLEGCWYFLDDFLIGRDCSSIFVSGLSDGIHEIRLFANDTFGNINSSSVNFRVDLSPPTYSRAVNSTPLHYDLNYSFFNISWSDFSGIDSVLFESNFSGHPRNYTMTRGSDGQYYVALIVPAGRYYWKSYANDSFGHLTNTTDFFFTIEKSNRGLSLYLNKSENDLTVGYGEEVEIESVSVDDSHLLYRNGEIVQKNQRGIFAAGYYNYTAVFNGNQNYSASTKTIFLNITKAVSKVDLLLNDFSSDLVLVVGSNLEIKASLINPSDGQIFLYENGELVSQGEKTIVFNKAYSSFGEYLWTVVFYENQNYTYSNKSFSVRILDRSSPAYSNLKTSPSSPTSYLPKGNYTFNSTWTDDSGIEEVIFEFNNRNYTLTDGEVKRNEDEYYITLSDLSANNYYYRWHANDSSNNFISSPNQNYFVGKALSALFLVYSSPSLKYGSLTNARCFANNPESSVSLTRNSEVVSMPDNEILKPGLYNYICSSSETENYTSAITTASITITKADPNISLLLNNYSQNIVLPFGGGEVNITASINLINNADANLTLFIDDNYTLSELNNIFYNITFFSGNHTIKIYFEGNENYTSGFIVRNISVQELPPNNNGGTNPPSGGGGGSGGGGSQSFSSFFSNKPKTQEINLTIEDMGDIVFIKEEDKLVSIKVKNTGGIFLNKCKLKTNKDFEGLIDSSDVKNINVGEITEFIFKIKYNKTFSDKISIPMTFSCLEKDFEFMINVVFFETDLKAEIKDMALISKKELGINVTLTSNLNIEEELTLKVFDSENSLVFEKTEKFKVEDGKSEKYFIADLSKASKGLLKIVITRGENSLIEEFFIFDSSSKLTGFSIFEGIKGEILGSIIFFVVFIVLSLLIIRRIIFFKQQKKEMNRPKVNGITKQIKNNIENEIKAGENLIQNKPN